MASHKGAKITLSKTDQQSCSERWCIFTNINHSTQRGVEWVKDKEWAEVFSYIRFYEIY